MRGEQASLIMGGSCYMFAFHNANSLCTTK